MSETLAKPGKPPHTGTMSEVGELPQTPEPATEPLTQRLEDMEEFKKLSPEHQEKLLALREQLAAEAMNPERVVTRSIDEMGFWEGMKETMKPHQAKLKELAFNDLKATASAAISLVPVLGEGMGLGTGLFGIGTKEAPAVVNGVINLKSVHFEPLVRLEKAGRYAKTAFNSGRTVNEIVKYSPVAQDAAELVTHVRPEKSFKAIGKGKDVFNAAKSKARDIFSFVGATLDSKGGAIGSLSADFNMSAKEGTKVLAGKMGVAGIQEAQNAKTLAKNAAFAGVKVEVAAKNAASGEWYKFPLRWARSATGEVRANIASIKMGKEANKGVNAAVETALQGKNLNKAQKWVESGVMKAAPGVIEGTHMGAYKNFFEKWLNLTPDVPIWISTTTGVLEFLGMHGIDALPGASQLLIDKYKRAMVTKDAAMDVLGYTMKRVLKTTAERQQAAKTFAPQMAAAPMAA